MQQQKRNHHIAISAGRHNVATLLSTKQPTHIYRDEEFGDIRYRRLPQARYVRVRIGTDGMLQATMPLLAPLSSLATLIDTSREQLRAISLSTSSQPYTDGMNIGHSHTLHLLPNRSQRFSGTTRQQRITISYPVEYNVESPQVQSSIKSYVAQALRKESRAYLPRRLAYLAEQGGFAYKKVRFAHQSGRWGSCSSSGTISLNIALMNLSFELIDYVLIHELSHTVQMNHSPQFWRVVEQYYPTYKNARKLLKTHNPYL